MIRMLIAALVIVALQCFGTSLFHLCTQTCALQIRYLPKRIPDVNPAAPAGAECLRQLLLKLTYVFEGEEEV